jgi:hypothetical protein
MRRSLAAIFSLSLLALAPTAALARGAAPIVETHEDMLARRAEDARATVERHFAALAAGDAKAVRAEWTRDARVTSIDASGISKKQTLSTALSRWLEHHDGMSWKIVKTTRLSDRELEFAVQVTWNGTTFDDRLCVVASGKRMLIRQKSSRPRAEAKAETPHSGY